LLFALAVSHLTVLYGWLISSIADEDELLEFHIPIIRLEISNVFFDLAYHTTPRLSYKNLDGLLFFNTNGCLCTLGMSPNPIALRIAFATFL